MPPGHALPSDLAAGDPRRPRRTFAAAHGPGDVVFLRLRRDRLPGLVTEVAFRPDSAPLYEVSWGDGGVSHHWGPELAVEYEPDYADFC